MLLLVAALSSAASPPTVRAEAIARVSVNILRPHRASPRTWEPALRPNQRELLKKEPDGTEVRLRLTEFE